MTQFTPQWSLSVSKTVLICAAHPDDEVLGCGGVIARHVAEGAKVYILCFTDGEAARLGGDTRIAARHQMAMMAADILGAQAPFFFTFEDQRLDTKPLLILIRGIEQYASNIQPNIVYTHHAGDLNSDHRIVTQAVMTAFRPLPGSSIEAIYGYEVLSSTEWSIDNAFVPQRFVSIDLGTKKSALSEYAYEMRDFPHARSMSTVISLAKFRGSSAGLWAAEAFTVLREVVR